MDERIVVLLAEAQHHQQSAQTLARLNEGQYTLRIIEHINASKAAIDTAGRIAMQNVPEAKESAGEGPFGEDTEFQATISPEVTLEEGTVFTTVYVDHIYADHSRAIEILNRNPAASVSFTFPIRTLLDTTLDAVCFDGNYKPGENVVVDEKEQPLFNQIKEDLVYLISCIDKITYESDT